MELPDRIGRYEIRRLIGRGGMGQVFVGWDEELGREVAIKMMLPLEQRAARSRLVREARAAAAVRHPNVATIHEVGTTDEDVPYIVMELCEGETLTSKIRRGDVDLRKWFAIAIQLAAGIAAAHRAGVLHRDIKSSNIFIESDGLVKILDFGLARSFLADPGELTVDAPTTESSVLGTTPYLSPEQAAGGEPDIRSDLFATGVVLYELATGKLPFQGTNPLSILEKIREEEPQPLESTMFPILPEIANIISRLLQKVPADRYQTADALLSDLREVERELQNEETLARSGVAPSLALTRPRQKRTWTTPLLLLLLLLAAGLAGMLLLEERRPRRSTVMNEPIESIAVLPLANLTADPDEEFLSIGLADALISRLQSIRDLRVRPTSSVTAYQGARPETLEVARELEVDGLLTGNYLSETSASGAVRVTLQLVDARRDETLWSQTFDGNRENLLELIDEVSEETISALRRSTALTGGSDLSLPSTDLPEAYEHYLRAIAISGSADPEVLRQEIEELEQAVAIDPEFAAAWARLALAVSLAEVRGFDPGRELEEPELYARRAVRLDPTLAEAHVALGRTLIRQPNRFSEGMRENLAALQLNPDEPSALASLISYFVAAGELDRTACLEDRFVNVDPSSNEARLRGYWQVNAVNALLARERARFALAHDSTELVGHDIAAWAAIQLGEIETARRHQAEAERLVPGHYLGSSLGGLIAAAEGDREAALEAISEFGSEAETNHWAALRIAMIFARLGEIERAVDWVERARELGNHSWYFLVSHPWLQPLQSDPDFRRTTEAIRHDLDRVRDDAIGMHQLLCGR